MQLSIREAFESQLQDLHNTILIEPDSFLSQNRVQWKRWKWLSLGKEIKSLLKLHGFCKKSKKVPLFRLLVSIKNGHYLNFATKN